MLTELMCNCEGCLQTVIFNNGATSIRITHGANISHTQSVTGMSSTKDPERNSIYMYEPCYIIIYSHSKN